MADDILEVIGARARLIRSGKNYKALCPFHGERTPSMVISPRRNRFHCFGCGVKGNARQFEDLFRKRFGGGDGHGQ